MLKINDNGITRPMTLTEQAEYERMAAEMAQMKRLFINIHDYKMTGR